MAVHKVNIPELSWNLIGAHSTNIHDRLALTESAVPSMRSVKSQPAFGSDTENREPEVPECRPLNHIQVMSCSSIYSGLALVGLGARGLTS